MAGTKGRDKTETKTNPLLITKVNKAKKKKPKKRATA